MTLPTTAVVSDVPADEMTLQCKTWSRAHQRPQHKLGARS